MLAQFRVGVIIVPSQVRTHGSHASDLRDANEEQQQRITNRIYKMH